MNVFELGAKIGLDTKGFHDGLEKAESGMQKLGGAVKTGVETIVKAFTAATKAATKAGVEFAKSAVSTGAQFDSSMSQVAATMGKTVDEIGELRDFAQEMGSTTAFSASQAADALNYMALAGYDANQSMSMLPTVLDLAAAGGIELARASDMVTDAASALGLTFDDTKVMVDQMAMASSKTNTSVAQLGDAILAVGGTAKTLKGGTAELTQTLGLMADNGIKAAEAGTHMRNIMLAMTPSTKDAVAAWEMLGVQAYDNEGKLRNMSDIFTELKSAMSDFSDEERTNILSDMFHVTDLAAVNALLDTDKERWDAVSDAIDGAQGSASKMAETQLDNLTGDVTLFKSAWEGLQIVISDKLVPVIRPFIQMFSTLVSTVTSMVKNGASVTDVFKKIGSAAEGFGIRIKQGIMKILPQLVNAVPDMIKSLVTGFERRAKMIMNIAPKIINAIIDGIKENIPVLMDVAQNIIEGLRDFIRDDLPTMLETALDIIVALVDGITEALPELVPVAIDMVLTLVEKLTDPDTLVNLVDAALELILALADGLVEALPKLLDKAPVIVDNLVTSIVKIAPRLLKAAGEIILKFITGLTNNLPKIYDKGKDIVARLILGLFELKDKMTEAAKDLIEKFLSGIGERYQKTFEAGKEIINKFKDGVMEMIHGAFDWGKDMMDNFIGGINDKMPSVANAALKVATKVAEFIHFSVPEKGPLSDFDESAPDMMNMFIQGIKDNEKKLQNQIKSTFDFQPIINAEYSIPVAEASQTKQAHEYGVTNNYVINISGNAISNDYDSYRAAQKISERLATLQIQQRRAIGV